MPPLSAAPDYHRWRCAQLSPVAVRPTVTSRSAPLHPPFNARSILNQYWTSVERHLNDRFSAPSTAVPSSWLPTYSKHRRPDSSRPETDRCTAKTEKTLNLPANSLQCTKADVNSIRELLLIAPEGQTFNIPALIVWGISSKYITACWRHALSKTNK